MEEMENTNTEKTVEQSPEVLKKQVEFLTQQCNSLYSQLQRANMTNAFQRLEFLFKVVKYGDNFPLEFLQKSVAEIQEMMEIPEEDKPQED